MHIIFRDRKGLREGVVLTASENRMRVAVRGCTDTTEMKLRHGHWTVEGLGPAEIESLVLPGDLSGSGSLAAGIQAARWHHAHKAVA